MAFDTLIGGLPPDVILDDGCMVVAEAIDPTTGDPVTGVTVRLFNLYVDDTSGASVLPDAVPLLTPLQLEQAGG